MYAITKEAYRRKIQAQLGFAHALFKLKELKKKNAHSAAESPKEISDLEKKIEETRKRLNELFEAGDEAWENIDDVSEELWTELKTAVNNAVLKIGK
ncbi:hypothetical protein [Aminivibrio sp.]|jgi:predicted  nucleic acid-binding Zn-ribbon protein|uniref:hypothetical protein n=1 Tax=Aminivibrio sp. TaxID=1872489 RepID=UPI001A501D18|nr:hypothetical protein [Aminivibrio sp.]MBL3538196.1 hypothetical protein [Aminivibrio sp.]MDK2958164.1 hypothetical protein [Synergistaceae bacterium]